ncbi:MAG: ABC transporter substrate-binding protein [Propionibacteriales bacterium]|nr:ABC transporter substrate-binding protein [Propionibacteriales bacterium]
MDRRSLFISLGAAAVVAGLSACSSGTQTTGDPGAGSSDEQNASSKPGGAGGDVGVFTWWADGSEKLGLEALQGVFKSEFPNDTFVNLAVAGGAGSNAKAKLAADLANNNPPDSFQGHAGAELLDYISKGQIVAVNDIIDALGGTGVFPESLLSKLTVKESIYSVPSNIHRANVVWTNTQLLAKAKITDTPANIAAWIADMDKLRSAGVATPLAVSGSWTQVQLLETVLLSDLGTEAYTGLFSGETTWDGPEVTKAVDNFGKLLSYANKASDGDDWPVATDMVIDGKAAYNVMGDWAVAQFADKKKEEGKDWGWFPVPGTDGTFDFLADSFTLPKGAKNPGGAKDWLTLVGGAAGQKAFSLAKGSIPARIDVPADEFPAYQQKAMESFKSDKIASSIAHGAAVNQAWLSDITTAVSKFYGGKDAAALIKDLTAAAEKNRG